MGKISKEKATFVIILYKNTKNYLKIPKSEGARRGGRKIYRKSVPRTVKINNLNDFTCRDSPMQAKISKETNPKDGKNS